MLVGDAWGRPLRNLRVSVTDRCNLRCSYCMPEPEYVWLPNDSTATAKWLLANGYREDVRTERSFVAARSDLPPLTPYLGTSSGCFPGP